LNTTDNIKQETFIQINNENQTELISEENEFALDFTIENEVEIETTTEDRRLNRLKKLEDIKKRNILENPEISLPINNPNEEFHMSIDDQTKLILLLQQEREDRLNKGKII
jgi:hypothetical protein